MKNFDDYVLMPRHLTAENGAKALLSGEFSVEYMATCSGCYFDDPQEDCEVCGGEVEYRESVQVDWGTIKNIYAKVVDCLSISSSDRYRAELYDEVWQKSRDMGYGNVTEALLALERAKAAPMSAAQQLDTVPAILTDEDMRQLRRFHEICEDSDAGGHDLPKEAVKRLERAGALRSCGFGRHEITLFGDYLLGKDKE